jgi:hypothetical protein
MHIALYACKSFFRMLILFPGSNQVNTLIPVKRQRQEALSAYIGTVETVVCVQTISSKFKPIVDSHQELEIDPCLVLEPTENVKSNG